jgi:hypothetical protein
MGVDDFAKKKWDRLTKKQQKLIEEKFHPHDYKPNSKLDIFKDEKGDLYMKPKDGSGPGEPLFINFYELFGRK